MPKKRGIEGPVKSISKTPTEWPCSDSVRASCVVILDLPTPPLPERTRTIFRMLLSGIVKPPSRSRLNTVRCEVETARLRGFLCLHVCDGEFSGNLKSAPRPKWR